MCILSYMVATTFGKQLLFNKTIYQYIAIKILISSVPSNPKIFPCKRIFIGKRVIQQELYISFSNEVYL